MPIKYKCHSCGEVFYEGLVIKSPEDLIKFYEGKCPRCKQYLKFSADSVDIKPYVDKSSEKTSEKAPGKATGKSGKPKS